MGGMVKVPTKEHGPTQPWASGARKEGAEELFEHNIFKRTKS